jgi:16S rRNA processing protein RimM
MGLAIVDEDGTNYGVVIQLHNFGAGEFFDIKTEEGSKVITLPFNKDSVLSIDLENKKIIIDKNYLLD